MRLCYKLLCEGREDRRAGQLMQSVWSDFAVFRDFHILFPTYAQSTILYIFPWQNKKYRDRSATWSPETRRDRGGLVSSRLFSRRDRLVTCPRYYSVQKRAKKKSRVQKFCSKKANGLFFFQFFQFLKHICAILMRIYLVWSYETFLWGIINLPLPGFSLGFHLFQHRQFVRKTVVVCVYRETHKSGTVAKSNYRADGRPLEAATVVCNKKVKEMLTRT